MKRVLAGLMGMYIVRPLSALHAPLVPKLFRRVENVVQVVMESAQFSGIHITGLLMVVFSTFKAPANTFWPKMGVAEGGVAPHLLQVSAIIQLSQ